MIGPKCPACNKKTKDDHTRNAHLCSFPPKYRVKCECGKVWHMTCDDYEAECELNRKNLFSLLAWLDKMEEELDA